MLKRRQVTGIPLHRIQGQQIMLGGSFGDILQKVGDLGKLIISNPNVQKSAKELASQATGEIIESIRKRVQQKKRDPRIDQLLGKGIRYLN